jgi:UDP-N-acetylmuramate--alanine ligase
VSLQANALGGFDFQFLPGTIVSLQVPGHHNVRNALAALGVTDLLGLPVEDAARALAEYRGAGRRFELRGEAGGVTVIDDYAHHPTEIRATLAAARARFPGRPIWACWQPHTYSRTRTLLADFAGSFAEADQVVVTEIYPAREADPGDFSARQVVAEMDHPGVYFAPNLGTAAALLGERLEQGDVLLVLSAGDGDWVSGEVLKALKNRRVVE